MIGEIVARSDVSDVLQKALDGRRLDMEDGMRLARSQDVHAMGVVANEMKKNMHADTVYYVVNRHINYTDMCANKCRFCAFSRRPEDPEAYVMSIDEVVEKAKSEYEKINYTELHIVGGCHPGLSSDYYFEMLSTLKDALPGVHLQAFTAVEIANIAQVAGLGIHETLVKLKEAGLGSIPGGGAEVFAERVRGELCPEKLPSADWLSIMKAAHRLGIRSNSTMLYGHVESWQERLDHLLRLREAQDETGGFMTFIPLKFHPENTDMADEKYAQSAQDDMKLFAISRLMLDNIAHIKTFWIMLGVKLAQVALGYGADDFDGTVVEEKITHRAGAHTPVALTVEEIRKLVVEAGGRPVERDTVYNEVTRDASGMLTLS